MPAWVEHGYTEYAKRLSGMLTLELVEIEPAKRSKNQQDQQYKTTEAQRILAALRPNDFVVCLEVTGHMLSTEDLAARLEEWQMQGRDVALVVGGPDGIGEAVLAKADAKISLSKLTLPHPLVRVLLAEQLYRAHSINIGHPYHRA